MYRTLKFRELPIGHSRDWCFVLGGLIPFLIWCAATNAQETTKAAPAAATSAQQQPAEPIEDRQLRIQRDYQRFEKLLYDLAEHVRLKDPERAGVLYRARSQSQEGKIVAEMQAISELLREGKQYGAAADRQDELLVRMRAVLKLLQSLDERERITKDIQWIEERLKEINKLIARQKDVHADTLRGQSPDRSESQQKKVAEDASQLAEKIDERDRQRLEQDSGDKSKSADDQTGPPENQSPQPDSEQQGQQQQGQQQQGQQQQGQQQQGQQQQGQQQQGQQQQGQQQQGQQQQGQQQQGQQQQGQQQQGQQQQGQQQQGQQQQGQQQQGQQQQGQQQQTPGRQELEQAREAMQKAIEKLQQELPDKAGLEQQEAIGRLEKLKAELERILRQLREEEKETYLTLLEARFQNMLRKQERINGETTRLDSIPQDTRPATFSDKAVALKRDQDDNALEAEKALTLLKEEGSSVAFPEAIEQMRENMELVSDRLAAADTGPTTQLVEQLIVDSLNEMILAFQKELEKQQEKKQQQGQPQQQQSSEPGLVNQLAELKMIRSLQKQVNRITEQVGKDVQGEQARDPVQLKLIDDLARRQQRIQEATYDLTVGKNQ